MVRLRRLPLYSELLTRLGPTAARELTEHYAKRYSNSSAGKSGPEVPLRRRFSPPPYRSPEIAPWCVARRSRTGRGCCCCISDQDDVSSDHRTAAEAVVVSKAEEDSVIISANRGGNGACSMGSSDALDLRFKAEVEKIERILTRIQVMGVERWLQLQRCAVSFAMRDRVLIDPRELGGSGQLPHFTM